MCTVSMIGDHYNDKWKEWTQPPTVVPYPVYPWVSREEYDKLKEEVENMKELLKKAKQYDEEHGELDCELDEKLETLRKVAELVGVDLDEVFGK